MNASSFVLKGDICYSRGPMELVTVPDGYLICADGLCQGVFPQCPSDYQHLPLIDCSGRLITPGLTDLHIHAPQYAFRALGMDLELLDWLNTHTFPAESKYRDAAYAQTAYRQFVEDLYRGPNTRACIFATLHTDATLQLMDLLENSGLKTLVGKVNMDRNGSPELQEANAAESLSETRRWLAGCRNCQRTRPILTPRFIPSCTDELMLGLRDLQRETGLPVQSHLSENQSEVDWVRQLCPDSSGYGRAYLNRGLFGGPGCPTIMAHCVLSDAEETALLKQQGVYIAHCPASNTNLASGIAPVRRYLQAGIPMGLGSDVAGGTAPSIFRAMADAIQVSKLRWRLVDSTLAPLTSAEAFYLGTLGGGSFFGQAGSFLPGYELDALVIDDSRYRTLSALTLEERLDQTIYLSEDRDILHKYVAGICLF